MRTSLGDAASCGDWAWIRLEVDRRRIVAASGEGEGVAELCRSLCGLDTLAASALSGPELALDALQAALAPLVGAAATPGRVAVAMSGGVDSAVALLRARAAGREPIGVTLRLWTDPAGPGGERACCSPSSVRDARTLCHAMGVPHVCLDLREPFRGAVVRPFLAGYARGETPNPCVRCNGSFRFQALAALARRLGAEALATGHYARIVERDGVRLLARGVDPLKDQSYMLATLTPAMLERLWLPLGDSRKSDVREEAAAAGIAAARRPESQEACFLAGDDYRDFLERHGMPARTGALVDQAGRRLGSHRGHWRFTPGQRRGHGVAADEPLYVVSARARDNTVVLGPRAALQRTLVSVRPGRVPIDPRSLEQPQVKLRYRSPAVATHLDLGSNSFRLRLDEAVEGVAPGQTAVVYDRDVVVGAGRIASAR